MPDPWAVVSHTPTSAPPAGSDPWAVVSHEPQQPGAGERFFKSLLHAIGLPANPQEAKQKAAQTEAHPFKPLLDMPAIGGMSVDQLRSAGSTFGNAGSEMLEGGRAVVAGRPLEAAGHTIGALGYGTAGVLTPLGGQALVNAGEQAGSGDVAGAAGTATPLVAPLAIHALAPGAKPAPAPLKAATEPAHVEALTGFLKTTKTDPHITATTALPEARDVAARTGVDTSAFQGRKGGEIVDGVFRQAIQEHRAQYAALRRPVENAPLDTTPIAQAYLDRITPEMRANAPEIANRLEAEAGKFADIKNGQVIGVKPQPLSQVDAFRERMNNELNAYFQKSKDQQVRSDVEVRADEDARNAAAESVYQTISKGSNTPIAQIREMQQRQGALIESRRDVAETFKKASGAQGGAVSGSLRANPPGSGRFATTVGEKVSHLYPSRRGVERAVAGEVGPKPLGVLNRDLKLMFDKLAPQQPSAIAQPQPPTATAPQAAPVIQGGAITQAHVTTENAFYTQARAELGADATPSQVLQRVQQLKLQAPQGGAGTFQRDPRTGEQLVKGEPRGKPSYQVEQPQPPSASLPSTPVSLSGPEKSAAIAGIMAQLKQGQITEQQADARIQRLNGGGGRKLIRMPRSPE